MQAAVQNVKIPDILLTGKVVMNNNHYKTETSYRLNDATV
jgi:hypothetical protein